jgi:hypothetical protein
MTHIHTPSPYEHAFITLILRIIPLSRFVMPFWLFVLVAFVHEQGIIPMIYEQEEHRSLVLRGMVVFRYPRGTFPPFARL